MVKPYVELINDLPKKKTKQIKSRWSAEKYYELTV